MNSIEKDNPLFYADPMTEEERRSLVRRVTITHSDGRVQTLDTLAHNSREVRWERSSVQGPRQFFLVDGVQFVKCGPDMPKITVEKIEGEHRAYQYVELSGEIVAI